MKKSKFFLLLGMAFLALSSFSFPDGKLVSTNTHIKFFSHTAVEDIEANNNTAVSTINTESGDVVFSVPMQGFEFEIPLMQKHFNGGKFLDTKKFPKGKFKGKITNLDEIDFTKDGTYNAMVKGDMTIKEKTKPVSQKGTITVKDGKIMVMSKFNLTLADYDVTFAKGKPSKNIAKDIEITVHSEYKSE